MWEKRSSDRKNQAKQKRSSFLQSAAVAPLIQWTGVVHGAAAESASSLTERWVDYCTLLADIVRTGLWHGGQMKKLKDIAP